MAKKHCKELKEKGVDVIVAVTFLPLMEDKKIAQEVKELDIVLGKGEKGTISWFDESVLVYRLEKDSSFGRIDLVLKRRGWSKRSEVKVYPSWRSYKDSF